MKIFAAGDLHADSSLAKALAQAAASKAADVILLAGDVVEDDQVYDVLGPFLIARAAIALVHGNHESAATLAWLAQRYGAKFLHDYAFELAGVGFFGCGGANCGLNALTEEEIYQILKRGFEKVSHCKKKVMLTHMHSSGTIADKLALVKGSTGVRRAIEAFQPDIAICSHAHEAEGIEELIGRTKVVNVGRRGAFIEV